MTSEAPKAMSLRSLARGALGRPISEFCAAGPLYRVSRHATLADALGRMSDLRVGSLLVGDEAASATGTGEPLDGIFTERDVLEKLDFAAPLTSVTVNDLMTPYADMTLADETWSLDKAMHTMQAGHFRHLPVVREGRVASIVSMRDAARALAQNAAAALAGAEATASPDVAAAAAVSADDVLRARSQKVRIALVDDATPSIAAAAPPSCIEVPHSSTVAEAVTQMRKGRAGSVLVPTHGETIRESRHGFGIFTERDYLRVLGGGGGAPPAGSEAHGGDVDSRQLRVSAVMTEAAVVRSVTPELPAHACLAVLAREGIRHLPVMSPPTRSLGGEPPSASAMPMLRAVLSMRDLLGLFLR